MRVVVLCLIVVVGLGSVFPECARAEELAPPDPCCDPDPLPPCCVPDDRPTLIVADGMRLAMGGQFRVVSQLVNFDRHALVIDNRESNSTFAALRLRPWFNLFDSTCCKYGVYTQLEIGHVFFGEDAEFPKTFGPDPDEVGVELRRGYFWMKPCSTLRVRAGILDWQDRFGERPGFAEPWWAVDRYDTTQAVLANSVWDFNVAGVDAEWDARPMHWRASALVIDEEDDTFGGEGSAWLLGLDVDREVGCALFGASAYYLRDDGGYSYGTFGGPEAAYDESWDLWFGLRAHVPFGPFEASAFAIYNRGATESPDFDHDGWAFKGQLAHTSGCTTYRVQSLYSTGDDGSSTSSSNEFRTIAQSESDDFGAQGYWSYLALTSPHGPSDVDDLGVGLQNRGLGLFTVQGSVEHRLNACFSLYASAGWLQSAEENPLSRERAMGFELMTEARWKLGKYLTFDLGGAYLFTGDFYRNGPAGPDPDDLFSVFARLQLEF